MQAYAMELLRQTAYYVARISTGKPLLYFPIWITAEIGMHGQS